MPDSTISNLSSLTGAGLAPNDIFALVDVSDTSMGAGGTNKKITRTELCTFDMGTITTSTPILNLAQTWNNGAVTFTGLKLNVTDTASVSGSLLLDLQSSSTSKFSVTKFGQLLWGSDNTADIGASGASRPKNVYVGGFIVSAGNISTGASFQFASKGNISSPSDGIFTLYNAGGTDFGRLQFGGTTSSFPALKRVGGQLQARLADDSGYAGVRTSYIQFSNATTVYDNADGVLTLFNAAQTSFGCLNFGGTTSSFPSLKRSSTSLLVRLADDSGFGFFNAYVDSSNTTAVNSVGFRGVPQNTQNADYTFTHTDSGKQIFHDEATPRTYTIPANGSLAYDIGTTITIINNTGAGNITLNINSDILRRGDGISGTGSRTIGPDSVVTLIKTKTTEWVITGAFF